MWSSFATRYLRSSMSLAIALYVLGSSDGAFAAEPVFFIAGNPSQDLGAQYAVTLFQGQKEPAGLAVVRTLATTKQGSTFVRLYDDLGIAIVGTEGGPMRAQFEIVDFHDPAALRQLEFRMCAHCNIGFPIKVILLALPKLGPVIAIPEVTFDKSGALVKAESHGLTLTGSVIPLPWSDYANAQSSSIPPGVVGLVQPDVFDGFDASDGEFKQMMLGKPIPLSFTPPDLSEYKQKSLIFQYINNSKMRVLSSHEMRTETSAEASTGYLIQSKASGKWKKLVFDGSRDTIQAFGHTIVVTIRYKRGFLKERATKIVPGRSDYFPGTTLTHTELDWSGEVVFADSDSTDIAKLNLGSADFDVLLATADQITYRIGSSIYSRSRSKGAFGEPKLLFTDERIVPAIHWAFTKPGK